MTSATIATAAGTLKRHRLFNMLHRHGLMPAVAILDHLLRLPILLHPDQLQHQVSTAAHKTARDYKLCSAAVRNARVAGGALQPSELQQHLQLPGQKPGDAEVAPADLLTSCDGVPGVVLCWDGPRRVVGRLLAMLETGQLKARHVSANTLACLAALREEDALSVLDGLAELLLTRDSNPMGALLTCMQHKGLKWHKW